MLLILQIIGGLTLFIVSTLGLTIALIVIKDNFHEYKDSNDRKVLIKKRNEIDKLLAKLE
jgi:hypothetical protein